MNPLNKPPRAAALLGYAGLLPFVIAALAIHARWPDAALPVQVFIAYGAAILAFLGGIQWGLALGPGRAGASERMAIGVLPSLLAWLALLLDPAGAIGLLAAGFAALLAWERYRCPVIDPAWYLGLRTRLTLAVLLCHGVALAGLTTAS